MSAEKNWQFELEEYIKQGEPDQIEKSETWQTAIGLQVVDGLKTSAYLLDTAKEHIEGKISIDEAQKRIQSYYEQRTDRTEVENDTKEADIVSARIAKLLGEKAFRFSPAEWLTIHRRLFDGVFTHAGQIHPFQDGNGRVGRLIMFKECLKYNIVPFIIEDNLKMFYYRGLKEWDNEKGYLTDTCLTAQDKYKAQLDYFRIGY